MFTLLSRGRIKVSTPIKLCIKTPNFRKKHEYITIIKTQNIAKIVRNKVYLHVYYNDARGARPAV